MRLLRLSDHRLHCCVVAVAGHDPHPVTWSVPLTFYPGVGSFTPLQPAGDLRVVPLLFISRDRYTRAVRPVETRTVEHAAPGPATDDDEMAIPVSRPRAVGVAVEGRLGSAAEPLRAVVVVDGDLASNSFVP